MIHAAVRCPTTAGARDLPGERCVMSADDTTSSTDGRHTARKTAARDLAGRTGMRYAAALRHVTRTGASWQPRHRWVLTDDVRAWLDGKTWRGASYGNLRDWLDTQVSPVYECDWCGAEGNAASTDSSIRLVVTAWDPDVSPATRHIFTYKYHASCQPSSVSWAHPADIPSGPQRIALPASMNPEAAGEFDLDARALLAASWGSGDRPDQAVLLITVRVVEDHGEGARPWLTELELHLNDEGLGHPDRLAEGDCNWSLRVVTGYPHIRTPQWIALRTGQDDDRVLQHLLLCALDLPEGWADAARRDGRVTVAIGSCTAHWDDHAGIPWEVADDLDDLGETSVLITGAIRAPGCACAALTARHIASLIDNGVLVTAGIRVVRGEA